jgi:hypothetical protein
MEFSWEAETKLPHPFWKWMVDGTPQCEHSSATELVKMGKFMLYTFYQNFKK